MSLTTKRLKAQNREYFRKPYIEYPVDEFTGDDYRGMMSGVSFSLVDKETPGGVTHSVGIRPYWFKNVGYQGMENQHPVTYKPVRLKINAPFTPPPQPEVVPKTCLHLSIGGTPSRSGTIDLLFGESYQFTPSGGDGNYFFQLFSGPGSISAQGVYSVPPMEGEENTFIVTVGVTDGCRISKGALSRGENLFSTATFVVGPEEVEDIEVVEVSDTFTDSDGVLLENHTPDIGSGWTKVGSVALEINSNILTYETTGTAGQYQADGITIADGYVEALSLLGDGSILFRYVDSLNYYRLALTSANTLRVWKLVAGVETLILSKFEIGIANGKTCRCVFSGSNFEIFSNGVSKGTTTDASHSSGGIFIRAAAGSIHDTIMDNFLAVST